MYQMSSCSVSSLICCELCFFSRLSSAFCCQSLFPSLSPSPLPPPPCRLMLNLLLRLPPNTIHPPPLPPSSPPHACKSSSLIIGPYCTPTNLPTQHGVIASVQYCLIISADTREEGHYGDFRHSPSVRGLEATGRADR